MTIILLLFALHDNQCNLHKETDCIRLPGTWKRIFVFGYVHNIQDSFSSRHETELSDIWFSALEIGAAQFRCVTEMAPKGRTIRKVMVGVGNLEPQQFFFRYQIPCLNFF